jgi:hypothetical protein
MLSQNNLKGIKVIEKQLAFLVQTTVSFFSYGLPSGVNKYSFYPPVRKAASDDESNMQEIKKDKPKEEYLDFQIIQRVLYLCKISNQLRAADASRQISSGLETSLLNFIVTFKNHVLTDSRLIMLGAQLAEEPEGEALDTIEGVYNESKSAYLMLAKMSGQNNMQEVLEIFATKLVQNLLSVDSTEPESMRIIDLSLDVLS